MKRKLPFGLLITLGLGLQALALVGCSLSPQPEPPNVEPPRIEVPELAATPESPTVAVRPRIWGNPGSIEPPQGVVRAVNLDNDRPPADGAVQDDGSFLIEMSMQVGDELRLQVLADGIRSEPVDVVIGDMNETPTLAIRTLEDCLLLTPSRELDLGSVLPSGAVQDSVLVENRCAGDVQIEAPQSRVTVLGLSVGVGGTWPALVPTNTSVPVQIQFQPSGAPAGTEMEQILFITATSPSQDRRPVTLRARVE